MDKNPEESTSNDTSLSEHAEQAPATPLANQKGSQKTLRYLLILLAITVIGAGCYLGYRLYQLHNSTKLASTNTVSHAKQASHAAPPTTSATLGDLQVKYVTLPLTADQAATDPIHGPGESISTASGHYLLRDPRGFTYGQITNEGGKLIYDGQAVYNGPYLWEFALSQNGEHYIYTLDTSPSHSGGNIEVFVDNKLVQTYSDNGNDVTDLAVSNNGLDYAYVLGYTGSNIVKDGKTIFTNSYIDANFNDDLSSYIAVTQRNTDYYDVYVNGAQVAKHMTFLENNALIAISNNGQHYIYRNGTSLFRNGKQVTAAKSIDATAITDTGGYAVADLGSNNLDINGTSRAIPTTLTQGCTTNCFYNPPLELAISPSGDHYIIGTQQLPFWDLDGTQVSPDGNIEGTEFIGNTLYLYRWAQ